LASEFLPSSAVHPSARAFMPLRRLVRQTAFGVGLAFSPQGIAQTPVAAPPPATASVANAGDKPVIVSGTVGDEATRAAIVGRLRELYGAARVVDNLAVAPVLTPPNWSSNVGKLLTPALKDVSGGALDINGTNVSIRGDVSSELKRQELVSNIATSLNPTYVVRNGLRVGAAPQSVLDQTLANRTIEFEPSSATLTSNGRTILDQMIGALRSVGTPRLSLIGHTDASGIPEKNLVLSQARADAVKQYLVSQGIDGTLIRSQGLGAAQPIASNATPEGRARNRRIEFRVEP